MNQQHLLSKSFSTSSTHKEKSTDSDKGMINTYTTNNNENNCNPNENVNSYRSNGSYMNIEPTLQSVMKSSSSSMHQQVSNNNSLTNRTNYTAPAGMNNNRDPTYQAQQQNHQDSVPIKKSKSCCETLLYECVWPGLGLLGESYMLFSIGIVRPIWGIVFPQCFTSSTSANINELNDQYSMCSKGLIESLTYSVIVGIIIGMIGIGYCSRYIGRRAGSLLTASFMCIGAWSLTLLSYLASRQTNSYYSINTIVSFMTTSFFLFGIGVGGEYPLSASSASEQSMIEQQQQNNKNKQQQKQQQQQISDMYNQNKSPVSTVASSSSMNNNMYPNDNNVHIEPTTTTNTTVEQEIGYGRNQSSSSLTRGQRVQLVFSMQGMGIFLNSLIMTCLIYFLAEPNYFNNQMNYNDDGNNNNSNEMLYNPTTLLLIWQITYLIGAVILSFVLLSRYAYLKESQVWLDTQKQQQTNNSRQQQMMQQGCYFELQDLHKYCGSSQCNTNIKTVYSTDSSRNNHQQQNSSSCITNRNLCGDALDVSVTNSCLINAIANNIQRNRSFAPDPPGLSIIPSGGPVSSDSSAQSQNAEQKSETSAIGKLIEPPVLTLTTDDNYVQNDDQNQKSAAVLSESDINTVNDFTVNDSVSSVSLPTHFKNHADNDAPGEVITSATTPPDRITLVNKSIASTSKSYGARSWRTDNCSTAKADNIFRGSNGIPDNMIQSEYQLIPESQHQILLTKQPSYRSSSIQQQQQHFQQDGSYYQNDKIMLNDTIFQNENHVGGMSLLMRHYGMRLFGVSFAWLLWDVAFYGNKLFQSTFLLYLTGSDTTLFEFSVVATLNATIALLGYYGAAGIIDCPRIGHMRLQLWGFLLTASLFISVGYLFNRLNTYLLLGLYLASSFFGQLGPNATTFLIPAEIFPTEMRTMCHGIAAASGKIGALIASIAFHYIHHGQNMFLLSGYASLLAAVVTFCTIPETNGLDLYEYDKKWQILISASAAGETSSNIQYVGDANNPKYLSFYERNCKKIYHCMNHCVIIDEEDEEENHTNHNTSTSYSMLGGRNNNISHQNSMTIIGTNGDHNSINHIAAL